MRSSRIRVVMAGVTLLATAAFAGARLAPQDESSPGKGGALASQLKIDAKYVDSGCGPTSIVNWLASGNSEMRKALAKLSGQRSPVRTVDHVIETYGRRISVFGGSSSRFRVGNGTGPINLGMMARDILADHGETPPEITGEFLHRRDGESCEQHLARVRKAFADSIAAGVPVLVHIRGYRTRPKKGEKLQIFGHHVVVTAVETVKGKTLLRYIEPCGARKSVAFLRVARAEFTAPTDTTVVRDGRAVYSSKTVTGRPSLEFFVPFTKFAEPGTPQIVVANYCTRGGPVETKKGD